MSKCEVCDGTGDYPVINKYGRTLYMITCPECYGWDVDEEAIAEEKAEDAAERVANIQRGKYESAMAEKHAATAIGNRRA